MILLSTVKIFMMTGGDFSDDWSKFYYEHLRFSWWQVDIFLMKGRDVYDDRLIFHDDRSRFYYERSRFLWWRVTIFMISGQYFYDEWSRFSSCLVDILLSTFEVLMISSGDFSLRSWCYSKKQACGLSLKLDFLVFGVNQEN